MIRVREGKWKILKIFPSLCSFLNQLALKGLKGVNSSQTKLEKLKSSLFTSNGTKVEGKEWTGCGWDSPHKPRSVGTCLQGQTACLTQQMAVYRCSSSREKKPKVTRKGEPPLSLAAKLSQSQNCPTAVLSSAACRAASHLSRVHQQVLVRSRALLSSATGRHQFRLSNRLGSGTGPAHTLQ